MSRITQLRPLLKAARALSEPTESNREYIRGQAELISAGDDNRDQIGPTLEKIMKEEK